MLKNVFKCQNIICTSMIIKTQPPIPLNLLYSIFRIFFFLFVKLRPIRLIMLHQFPIPKCPTFLGAFTSTSGFHKFCLSLCLSVSQSDLESHPLYLEGQDLKLCTEIPPNMSSTILNICQKGRTS